MAMVVGTKVHATRGGANHIPIYFDRVPVALDASYPNGGYANLTASLLAVIGTGRTILDIRPGDGWGGYLGEWDRANDKLVVRQYPDALGPATVVPDATDLSALTAAQLVVISY